MYGVEGVAYGVDGYGEGFVYGVVGAMYGVAGYALDDDEDGECEKTRGDEDVEGAGAADMLALELE